MAKRVEDQDGLTPQEAKACLCRAQGMSQSDAWRRAFNRPRVKPETAWTEGSKLFGRPKVQQRTEALLRAAKPEDLDSIGQAVDDLLRLIAKCVEEGNLTAAANLMRQRLQVHGALRDRLLVTPEGRASDEELLERLAVEDPARLAALQVILGAPDGFGTRH